MIEFHVKLDEKAIADLGKTHKEIRRGLMKGMRKTMFEAERVSKSRMGRPNELQVGTGHLRRSIESGIDEVGSGIVGWIGSNVRYARIHELGGVIKPIKGKYLKFPIGGSWVSVKQVRIPPRPYLEPSILEATKKMDDIILNSIIEEVEK